MPSVADSSADVPDWSKLMHIGVHQGELPMRPELSELGLDEVHRICNRAWGYSRADFEPDPFASVITSQWRETCALAGSIAESLMLSAAAYLEAAWHSRAIAAKTEPPGMALAQRYLADMSIDTTVSVGHRLINFVARVARTNPTTRAQFASVDKLTRLAGDYEPFVTEVHTAWLSLNAETMRALRRNTPPVHEGSLSALHTLISASVWKPLSAVRAENFHRWRKEHESVSGVDQNSGRGSDYVDHAGNVIGRRVSAIRRRHQVSDGLTDQTTQIAGEGVLAMATAVDAVITDTLANLRQLTNGFVLNLDFDGNIVSMGGLGS